MADCLKKELDEEGVLLVTFQRPEKKNAFHDGLWDALAACFDEARDDPTVAVVVMTGAGENFSAGVDLTSFLGGSPAPRADGKATAYHACVDALFEFDKPLLAAVRGVAVGGGCTLTVASDIVYAGESLRMRLPFANLGVVPEIASSYLLQAAIGRQQAAEVMFTAEWIDAARALRLGMAARVFPDECVLAETMAKAREIAQWPVSSLQAIKQTLMAAHREAVKTALMVENESMMRLAGSPENLEAVMAFVEKRKPDFRQFRRR